MRSASVRRGGAAWEASRYRAAFLACRDHSDAHEAPRIRTQSALGRFVARPDLRPAPGVVLHKPDRLHPILQLALGFV